MTELTESFYDRTYRISFMTGFARLTELGASVESLQPHTLMYRMFKILVNLVGPKKRVNRVNLVILSSCQSQVSVSPTSSK